MGEMKVWKIEQAANGGYDTYDSAVVVAETEAEARAINPDGEWGAPYSGWCATPEQVTATEIGTTDLPAGTIVLASFNAG